MKQPADPNVLSAEELAARIGIGRRQVYEAAARNAIPHQRVGQRILFYWPAVAAWLSGVERGGGPPAGEKRADIVEPAQVAAGSSRN